MVKSMALFVAAVALAVGGVMTARPTVAADEKPGASAGKERFYEMRTYYVPEGKLDALHKRFRDHTNRLFAKHGIEMVGYWTPVDESNKPTNKLVFVLAYPSREAREAAWKAFASDPEWVKAKADSEKDGKLVEKAESVYMKPTDYSPVK